jgi:thioredoxin-related protein
MFLNLKFMRYLFLLVFVFVLNSFWLQKTLAQEVKWHTFTEAVELNKKNPRKIFIDVYTDWCGWCKVMDKNTFHDSTIVKILNEQYYAVKFNAETKDTIIFKEHTFVSTGQGNRPPHQLAAAMLQGKMSYPSVVFMNEKNLFIASVPGYKKPEELEPLLVFIANSLYEKKMNYQEFVKNYNSKKSQ